MKLLRNSPKFIINLTTPKQVQENYLKPLTDEGILDYSKNPDNKRQFLYFVSSKLTVNNLEEMNRQCRQ